MAEKQVHRATWTPFEKTADTLARLSGIEALQRVVAGELALSPFVDILGVKLIEIDVGRAVFSVHPDEHHYNPIGTVHGGLAATLIDSATGCAVYSTLAVGDRWSTLDLNVKFVRPLRSDVGEIRCTGTLVHVGGRIATAEGRVTDGDDKLYAHGVSSCLVDRAANNAKG